VATGRDSQVNLWRVTRRLLITLLCVFLLGIFLFWRIDSPRAERMRMAVVDRFVPGIEWVFGPVTTVSRMLRDFQSYTRVYEQNQELHRELQRLRHFKEAALQLEQRNARLRALNNVRLQPRLTYVTGEVITDSGSPFRQSGLVNIGRQDGVREGSAALDGLGLVGRVSGLGKNSARILYLTDASSRIPAIVLPSGQRTIVAGDNSDRPPLEFVEFTDKVQPSDRVVTSGDGGIFPPDLLIGVVERSADGRFRLRLSADYQRLEFVRVLRFNPLRGVDTPSELIGPRRPQTAPTTPDLTGELSQ